MASVSHYFNDTNIYQFGTNQQGSLSVIGSGSVDVESNAVRFYAINSTDDLQQWTVVYVDSTPDYPYRLKVQRSGFYLNTYCDGSIGPDCSQGTVNRASLILVREPEDVPDTGCWNAVPSDQHDGSYYWFNKANGTDAGLYGSGNGIYMTQNASNGDGGRWIMSPIPGLQASTSSSTSTPTRSTLPSAIPPPSSRSSRLPGGVIGGMIAGIVVAVLLFIALSAFVIRRRKHRRQVDRQHDKNAFLSEADHFVKPELSSYSDNEPQSGMLSSRMPRRNVGSTFARDRPSELHSGTNSGDRSELAAS